MAIVTITLPVHSEFQTNRLRWRDVGPSGLGNVNDLLASDPFGVLIQFQVRGDQTDDLNNLQVRVGDVDRGLNTPGPDLSDAWEGNSHAVTVQVPGLTDLVIPGPTNANVQQTDSAEPYIWVPGDDYAGGAISYMSGGVAAGLAAWVTDYLAAYNADNTVRATLVLSDEVPAVTDRDAGIKARAGDPTAALGAVSQAVTDRDAGISARAGNPTAAIGAESEAVPVTNRDAGISARAGRPAATLGAEAVGIIDRDAGIAARAGNPTAALGANTVPPVVESLLPTGKTALETALEAATAPDPALFDQVRNLWNPQTCPASHLPWLAWAVSVDYWDPTGRNSRSATWWTRRFRSTAARERLTPCGAPSKRPASRSPSASGGRTPRPARPARRRCS